MNGHINPMWFAEISLMMLVSGFGIPVMAALNSGLGRHLASAPTATAVLFGVGFLIAAVVAVGTGLPTAATFRSASPQLYLGAVFVVFYVMAVTFAAPRIGLANAVFFVLLGQLMAAATIDHFGLLGALRTALTARRGFGLLLMATGLYFARRPL